MTLKIVQKKQIYWWDFGKWDARIKYVVYARFLWIFWWQVYWSWSEEHANDYAKAYKEVRYFNGMNNG